ncbi:tandem-95 repeat protein [Pirellulaceae bacterium SH501]
MSRARSLCAAFIAMLGLLPSKRMSFLFSNASVAKASHRRVKRPLLLAEGLEQRQLLAGDIFYAGDTFVDAPATGPAAFVITTDQGSTGPDDGDTVTFTGANSQTGIADTGNDTDVPGLVLGTNAFTSLQDAINAATSNDTIYVAPGTYVGNIEIPIGKDGLTIRGAKFGVAGNDPSRDLVGGVGESTIKGRLVVLSNDVKINGIRVEDGGVGAPFDSAGIHVQASNTTVTDSVLYRSGPVDGDGYRGIINSVGAGSGLTVTNNVFSGWATGVYVQGANDVTVSGNEFVNNYVGVSADSYAAGNSNLQVTGNTFTDQVLEGIGIGEFDFGSPWMGGSSVSGNTFSGPGVVNYSPNLPSGTINGNTIVVTGTIQSAINASIAGDTIVVPDGTYTETITITKGITLVSENGASTTILNSANAGFGGGVQFAPGVTNARVGADGQGFTINGYSGTSAFYAVYFSGNNSNIILEDNVINSGSYGRWQGDTEGNIAISNAYGSPLSNISFVGNTIQGDITDLPTNPSYFGSGGPTLLAALVYINEGPGGTPASNINFTDNYITGQRGGVTLVAGEFANSSITGNTFVSVDGSALSFSGSGNLISGNTFTSSVPGSFTAISGSPGAAFVVNDSIAQNSISGFGTGIRARGSVSVSGSVLSNNTTAVLFDTGSTGSITDVNFNSGVDNETDIRFANGSGVVSLGPDVLLGGSKYFIDNSSVNGLDLTSFTATNFDGLNPAILTDAFAIENRMRHKLDSGNLSAGLIRVVSGELFVTTPAAEAGVSDELIQNAVDAADSGDTIRLQSGTYNEAVSVNKNLTIVGQGSVMINGSSGGPDSGVISVLNSTATNVVLSNLTLVNSPFRHGIRAVDSTGLTLTLDNVNASNNFQFGVGVAGIASLIVNGGIFSGNSQAGVFAGVSGLGNPTGSVLIQNASLSNNGAFGFEKATPGSVTISNSVISGNTSHGVVIGNQTGTVTLSGNDFGGQTAGNKVRNLSGTTVNASNNFWSIASLGNPASVSMFGSVDFTPMLDSDLDFDDVYIHAEGQQSGGNGRIPEGTVLVEPNGTLHVLPGSYTPFGSNNLEVPSTVTLSPGASPGTIAIGDLNQSDNSTLLIEIDGANPAIPQFDQILVNGTVTIGEDVNLALDFGYVPTSGTSWKLVDNDGIDAVSGAFANGTSFTVSGPFGAQIPLVLSYTGGDGNDIVLSVASYSTLYAASTQVGGIDRAFEIVNDNGPTGFSPGDVVRFTPTSNPANDVNGLIWGFNAFPSHAAAIQASVTDSVINSAGWVVNEDSPAGVNISMLGGTSLDGKTYNDTTSVAAVLGFQGQLFINVNETVTYIALPPANFDGEISFTYQVEDSATPAVDKITGTVFVDVLPVNDAPVLGAIEASTLAYTEDSPSENHKLQVTNSITVTDIDDTNIESATVSISTNFQTGDVLEVVGTLPSGVSQSYSAGTGVLTITGSATKADYQSILRNVRYSTTNEKPNSNTRTISFLINDGDTNSNVLTRNISVLEVNDSPVAVNDDNSVTENSSVTTQVLANDTDSDDSFSAGEFSIVSVGTATSSDARTIPGSAVTWLATGQITFNAATLFEDLDAGETRTVTIPYTMQDDSGATSSAQLVITVNGVNDAPVAVADSSITDEDSSVTVNVLANDTDVDDFVPDFSLAGLGTPTTTDVVVNPALLPGAFTFAGGNVTFNPAGLFNHLDTSDTITVTIPYTMQDNNFATSTANLVITVTGVNDPVVAVADSYTTLEDTPYSGNVLTNDTDPDDTPVVIGTTAPSVGSVVMAPNGDFTYTPPANFNGTATFTYFVTDGDTTTSAVVTIEVTAVNDKPSFTIPSPIEVLEDAAPVVNAQFITGISPGPSDESAQTVTFSVSTTNPSLFSSGPTINSAGEISYTLAPNANGSAVVTVTATDDGSPAAEEIKTFNFVVKPVNDEPSVAVPSSYTVAESDSETAVTVPGFATASPGGGSDEAGQTFTYSITGNTNEELFLVLPSISPTGVLTYTLAKDAFGTASISLQVKDSGGTTDGGDDTSSTITFDFEVTPVNDPPIADDDSFVAFEEDQGPFSLTVLDNDVPGPANESSQTLRIVSFTLLSPIPPGVLGNFAINPSEQTFDFTPPLNFNGTFYVEYQVRDNGSPNLDSNIATLTVTVKAVNDAPVISTSDPSLLSGGVTEDSTTPDLLVTKSIPFSDVELSDAHSVGVSFVSATPSLGVSIPPSTAAAFATALAATVSDASTGDGAGAIDWTFTLSNSLVDFLAAGETVTLIYYVTVTDDNTSDNPSPLSDTEQVVITLTGVNDTPVVDDSNSALLEGSIGEDAATPNLVVTNTVPFADKDLTNTHTVGVGSPTITPSGMFSIPGATSSALATALSATISDLATDDGNGAIDWTFTLASTLAQFLADGESIEVVYPVTVTDSSMVNSVVKNVTVTVTGANDAPVIDTSNAALLSGTVAEDSASPDLIISKVVTFDDVDLTDTHTVSATYVSLTKTPGSLMIPSATQTAIQSALAAAISNVSTGDGSGQVTWTFTLANNLLNFLNTGEQIVVTYDLKVTDESGVVASNSDTEQVVITLTGTNDAPVANDIAFQVGEGQTFIFDLAPFVEDAESVDGSLTYNFVSVTGQPSGTVLTTPSNSSIWTFKAPPSPSLASNIQIVYSVSDPGALTSALRTITVDIVDINDAPTAVNDGPIETGENSDLTVDVLANDDDPDPTDTPANFVLQSLGTITFTGVPSISGASIQIINDEIVFAPGTAFDILDAGDTATVLIPYTMADDEGLQSSATLTITVNGLNDAPVAVADTASIDENGAAILVDVLANDTDIDDLDGPTNFTLVSPLGAITFSGVSSLAGSSISVSGNKISFDPGTAFDELDPGDTATVTIPYTMTDGDVTSSAQLVVTVNGQNDGPNAINDTGFSTPENTNLTVNVLANDQVIDLNDLVSNFNLTAVSIVSVTPSSPSIPVGTPSVSVSGNEVLFQPGTAFDALDVGQTATVIIQYTVSDLDSLTDTGLLTITVNGVNDAPVGVNDTYSTVEDQTLTVIAANGVLVNDTDVDDKYGVKNDLTVNLPIVTAPTKGSVIMAANGSFNYTPFSNQNGQDTFVYRVRDNSGVLSAPVTVFIDIEPENDPPVANPDTATTDEDTAITGVTAVNVVGNDSDPENNPLTVTGAVITATTGLSTSPGIAGTVSVVANKVEFTPGAAFQQLDLGDTATVTISYTIQDPSGATATGQLVITVTGKNDAPVAVADTGSTNEDAASVTVDVVDNDSDPDLNNTTLTVSSPTITSVTAPVSIVNQGSVSVVGNQVQFTLSSDYQKLGASESATVTVAYTITDQHGATATANLVITVNGLNDAPTTSAGAPRTTLEDTPIVGDTGITSSDPDSNDVLTYEVISAPSNAASFTLNPNGSFSYTPAANFNGTDGFVYRVSDGIAQSAVQAVVINVTAVNDKPVISPALSNQTVGEDAGPQTVPGFLNFTPGPANESGQTATLQSVTTSATPNDLFAVAPAISGGTLTYTPAAGKSGSATVTVVIKDNGGTADGGEDTTTVTFNITVTAAPDAPVANDDTYTMTEGGSLNATGAPNPNGVLSNDTDQDGDTLTVSEVNGSSGNVGNEITLSSGAKLTVNSNGTFTYLPLVNWNGTDSFTYKATDGGLFSNLATVFINVTAVNNPPEILLTPEDGMISGGILEGGESLPLSSYLDVIDVDAGTAEVEVKLTAPLGEAIFIQTVAGPLLSGVTLNPTSNVLTITRTLSPDLISDVLSKFKLRIVDVDPGAAVSKSVQVNVAVSDLGNSPAPVETDTAILTFTAFDAAPTIPIVAKVAGVPVSSVTEGTTVDLTIGPFEDEAGVLNDPLVNAVIYWGDGSTTPLLASQIAALNVPGGVITVSHPYSDEAAMINNVIRISLFSQGKNDEVNTSSPKEYQNAGSTPMAVTGVAPAADVSHTGPYNEGSAAGLITVFNIAEPSSVDLALLRYDVDFGNDGPSLGDIINQLVPATPNFTIPIPASVLRDNPNAPIKVTLRDKDGLATPYLVNVPVNNVAPTLAAIPNQNATVGIPLTINGSFTDPGVVDNPWSIQFDWDNNGSFESVTSTGTQGAFSVTHTFATAGTHTVNARVIDKDGGISSVRTFTVNVASVIAGRHLFYNNANNGVPFLSLPNTFDSSGAANGAIDSTKAALLPGGGNSSFSNYSNYSRGLNGIIIDLAGVTGSISASDFVFETWDGFTGSGFAVASVAPTVTVLPGQGVGGTTRVKLTFADNAIQNTWLKTTVLANMNTRLSQADTFYFGHVSGDVNLGDVPVGGSPAFLAGFVRTSAGDTSAILANQPGNSGAQSVGISNPFDLNKDGRITPVDYSISLGNQSNAPKIKHISV